ncbi:MAG: hypothetical protein JXN64_00530 [Spirochaetes bacterium]|nr:hypothetical protein [Spirochaetota bacterium]
MSEKKIKNVVPVGIFLIDLFILLLLSAAISFAYFYFEARNRTAEIEKYTRSYSIPLIEAFANVAELSYKDNDLDKLKRLFREKIKANIIDEAFFVLSNGKIIVHSDSVIEKELKGNIATDEFAYNTDLIMLPIWTKVNHAQFMDYHIYNPNKKIPFKKDVIRLLKQYIYAKIDVSGWLVTRAVYVKGKSIGCVSFIISKDRIYKFLLEHYNICVKLAIVLAILSFIISFTVSVIIFIRYRSINKRKYLSMIKDNNSSKENTQEIIKEDISESIYVMDNNEIKIKEAIKIKNDTAKDELTLSGKEKIKDAILFKEK